MCEDDFLVEESRTVWPQIFGGAWSFEKYAVKEFEEIPAVRLMDDALTPSFVRSESSHYCDRCGQTHQSPRGRVDCAPKGREFFS